MLNHILEFYQDYEFIRVAGFDEAIIGVWEPRMCLVYSESACLEILEREMTHTEAVEFFNFNIAGAYLGEGSPIYITDDFEY